jgi:hypothetical protein
MQVLGPLASAGLATGLGSRTAGARAADLTCDVAIIGGGAAGTYAALGLRDRGLSVVVVERSDRLGGHCETYRDPASGAAIDIGVIVFPDEPLVRAHFGRFGVPLINANFAGPSSQFVDFRTGQGVAPFQPSPLEVGTALATYLQVLAIRYPFLDQNGFQLPEPGPVLDELLLPFGQWVGQLGLEALLPTFFLYEQGFGPLLEATTLYVLKNMSRSVVGSLLAGSFLLAPGGAGALYDAASADLGSAVLYQSELCDVVRRGHGARLLVRSAGVEHTVRASKLLFTAPPVLANFAPFDLDGREQALFSRFRRHHYWTAVAQIAGMPPGVSLVNAAPDTPFNLPPLPGIYSIGPNAAPGLFDIKYGSDGFLSDRQVQRRIAADIARVATEQASGLQLESFAIFKSHSPYSVVVSPEQVRDGFYSSLQALQGYRDTYYAGAAFQTHSSAAVWAQVEELLPALSA